MKNVSRTWLITASALMVTVLFYACNKSADTFDNPYDGGKSPLGIVFNNANVPVPSQGTAATTVVFQATGLLPFKDKLVFNFNGQPAEIVSVTDAQITVKVPESASTGATSITVDDQVFFGPQFTVLGKISFDPFFKPLNGTNNSVYDYYKLNDGRLLLFGAFTNYDNKGIVIPNNRIVLTSKEGDIDRSFKVGNAANGSINTVTASANETNFFIAGNFYQFDKMNKYIDNITRLLPGGNLDTVFATTFSGKKIGVPAFNGGTNGSIIKLLQFQNKIIAIGQFSSYISRRYNTGYNLISGSISIPIDLPTRDSVEVHQVMRFNLDGSIDKTYHFDISTNKGLSGANGSIQAAVLQSDGKVILIGSFTKFDEVSVGHIVRLNTNGTVDNTFNPGGTGANSNIYSLTYNALTQKYLISGIFGSYNGKLVQGLVQLNADGSIDNTFNAFEFDNGFPSYAIQLTNGLIVVNGSFAKYNGVKRRGFVVLSATGALAGGYNSTGDFQGTINSIYELQNQDGKRALILLGGITKFDSKVVSNITGIVLAN